MKKINLFDELLAFIHANKLGDDVLLFLVVLRLKHSWRDCWRIDGLREIRWQTTSTTFYEHRPSEFICQNESFSCSPFTRGQEYRPGIYFTQFWVTPTKLVAFLFTIDGSKVKLKKHLVYDPSDAEICWLKKYWSAYFWDDIEAYHNDKASEVKGHRVLGKYMMLPDDDTPLVSENKPSLNGVTRDKMLEKFGAFPPSFHYYLLDTLPAFTDIGIDIFDVNSPVLFLYLAVTNIKQLKVTAERIRQHPASTLMLVTNDPDIDNTLMETGHNYTLTCVKEANDSSCLYFYQVTKNK